MGKKSSAGGSAKPSAAKTAYFCFLQVCREEHQKRCPNQPMVLKEFSKTCAEKWRALPEKDKKKFNDMAARDKLRFQKEMETYVPPPGETSGRKRKKTKDPNAPKRYLSAFFMFCNEKRPEVQKSHPDWRVGDVAKELGKMWEQCVGSGRDRYEQLAAKDKERYEKDMATYHAAGGGAGTAGAKRHKAAVAAAAAAPVLQHHDDDDDDDDLDDVDDDGDDDYDEDGE